MTRSGSRSTWLCASRRDVVRWMAWVLRTLLLSWTTTPTKVAIATTQSSAQCSLLCHRDQLNMSQERRQQQHKARASSCRRTRGLSKRQTRGLLRRIRGPLQQLVWLTSAGQPQQLGTLRKSGASGPRRASLVQMQTSPTSQHSMLKSCWKPPDRQSPLGRPRLLKPNNLQLCRVWMWMICRNRRARGHKAPRRRQYLGARR
mmetsp:Transcript_25547/g.66829  ORF Transcript_25547/g.66829 Transcript_25547/m.66829 type:complete len:202 (+) Transcript_25547:506-1111(+)